MHHQARFKRVGLAAIPLALFLQANAAQAVTYAVSHTSVSNFGMSFVNPATGVLNGFTFSTDVAAHGNGSVGNYGGTDAAAACLGADCATWNNSFTAHGPGGGDFAYGDAKISNSGISSGSGAAASIGEIAAGQAGFASGSNSMIGTLVINSPGAVAFSFNAIPYLSITPGIATSFASFTITLTNSLGAQVFSWAPDGSLGSGISGGTESQDGVNLNLGITPGVTYNPGSGSFAAQTGSLASGFYSLNISMTNQVSAVPEAHTVSMMLAGLGLVGYVASRRQRRAV